MDEAKQIKEQGNAMFKAGKYEEALTCYTKALNLDTSGVGERNVYLKNRAACYLKLEKYLHAVNDCTTGESKELEFTELVQKHLSCWLEYIHSPH